MADHKLSEPRIVCAANRFKLKDGRILLIAGPRHFDKTMHQVLQFLEDDVAKRRAEIENLEQGFIDQHGKFYNRIDAWMIAALNGQIVKRVGGDGMEGFGLWSENLY